MENLSDDRSIPEQASAPVEVGGLSKQAADRFEIFEQVALERLRAGADATKPATFLPLPVRITAMAAAVITLLGVVWSVLARVPVQVNGTGAIVPPGGLESLDAASSGILRYQVSGFGPNILPALQRHRNELLGQFWRSQATVFTSNVNNAAKLAELVEAALASVQGQAFLLPSNLATSKSVERKSAPFTLSYPSGTVLARIQNDPANQELNASLLGTLPAERLHRQQRSERLERAGTLSQLGGLQSNQRQTLVAELKQRRDLYRRFLGLWKQGYLPGTTVLEEQSRINALEGQLLSSDSAQVSTTISRDDQLEQSKQAIVSSIDSLNKLENQLVNYLTTTTIFAPVNGFYILARNFANGSFVRQGDELITFTRTPPTLPSSIPVFLDASAAQQVSEGMNVLVTPKGISRAQYGGIPGRVIEINKLPLQGDGLQGAVGSRALVTPIQQLINAPYLVRVQLEQNTLNKCHRASSFDCYRWSSGRLPPHPVRLGTLADVQITTIYRRPVEFVMPALRRALGLVVDNK
jgi:multidrug resistance efflux pump